MLSGNNGILTRAGEAKEVTAQAQLEEEVYLSYMSYIGQVPEIVNDLEYYLNKISDANIERLATDTWYVSRGNAKVTISDGGEQTTGRVDIWDGTSIESPKFKDFNWYIYNPSQLKFLADYVNNGNTLSQELENIVTNAGYRASDVTMSASTMIYLMNDLDLGARPGKASTEEAKWEISTNEARKWTPIGLNSSMVSDILGTFEGNNHTIKGVYVNSTKSGNGHGLFGHSSTIQNLSIANSYIKGGMCTGGIVGALRGTETKIENCHNKNTTVILREGSNNYMVGGIVGQISSNTKGVYNCTNNGTIIAYGAQQKNGAFISCCGGIAGSLKKYSSILNCENFGLVLGSEEGMSIGGIVGETGVESDSVNNCYNSGNVNGFNFVGGIVGNANSTNITNCYNKGIITSEDEEFGSLIGYVGVAISYENLWYLSSLRTKAVQGNDYPNKNVMPIDNNFNSLREFLNWLDNNN